MQLLKISRESKMNLNCINGQTCVSVAPSHGSVGPSGGGGNLVINVGINEHRYSDPDEAGEGTEDTGEDTDVKVAIFQQV